MNTETRTYCYLEDEIDAPADLSPAEVREIWAKVHPALENAEYFENDDGSVEFRVSAGTKG